MDISALLKSFEVGKKQLQMKDKIKNELKGWLRPAGEARLRRGARLRGGDALRSLRLRD